MTEQQMLGIVMCLAALSLVVVGYARRRSGSTATMKLALIWLAIFGTATVAVMIGQQVGS